MPTSADTLPPELWIQIAHALSDRGSLQHVEDGGIFGPDPNANPILDLQNLSLTSKSFCEIARPLIFRLVCIVGTTPSSIAQALYMHQFLVSNPSVRNWIKTLRVRSQVSNTPVRNACIDIIQQTTSLRRLTFTLAELTSDLLPHVLRLSTSTLQELSFDEVVWDRSQPSEDAIAQIRSQCHSLKITRLAIRQRMAKGLDPVLSIVALFSLSSSLTDLYLDQTSSLHAYHLSSQTPSHTFQRLRHLEAPEPVQSTLDAFLAFLDKCPNIKSIKLSPRWTAIPKELEVTTPVTVVPQLQVYSGPYPPVKLMLPGRPVETLCFNTGSIVPLPLSTEFLLPFNRGSAQVRHLEISGVQWSDNVLSCIVSMFRSLEELSLTNIHYQAGPGCLLDALSKMPKTRCLRELRLSSFNLNDDEPPRAPAIQKQRTVIQHTGQTQPTLRTVSLLAGVYWFRHDKPDKWIVNFNKERTKRLFEPKVDS
ncbi:hypothetical protein FRB90_005393, partial [Tulasnella sp. 427]